MWISNNLTTPSFATSFITYGITTIFLGWNISQSLFNEISCLTKFPEISATMRLVDDGQCWTYRVQVQKEKYLKVSFRLSLILLENIDNWDSVQWDLLL